MVDHIVQSLSTSLSLFSKSLLKSSILLLVLFLLLTNLSGCTTTKIKEVKVPVEVKVPTYIYPEYPKRSLPNLPINTLNNDSTDKDVAIAYDKTINILMNEIRIYREYLYNKD